MPGAALGFVFAGYSLAALSLGGLATSALVAGSAGVIARLQPKRQEVGLAAFYLVSLALGVMMVSVRGSNVDLMHVLFGTVLAVDMSALILIASVSSATLLALAAIYRPAAVRSFDPAFLRSIGARSGLFQAIFLLAVVLVLVASFQAFGTLLAIGPWRRRRCAGRREFGRPLPSVSPSAWRCSETLRRPRAESHWRPSRANSGPRSTTGQWRSL
jgi:zinc/manganese transport system permease protein